MIRSLSIILLLTVFVAACDKQKFQTTPQIKIKSTNTDVVALGQALTVFFEFTDKEGDVDSLFMIRKRLNKRGPVTAATGNYRIPDFPATNKGEIKFTAEYGQTLTAGINQLKIPGSSPDRYEPDTMKLRFVAKDAAGNKSDTVDLDIIVIR
jgi:hypothetical protein